MYSCYVKISDYAVISQIFAYKRIIAKQLLPAMKVVLYVVNRAIQFWGFQVIIKFATVDPYEGVQRLVFS